MKQKYASVAEKMRAYRERNLEGVKARERAYFAANREKCNARSQAWRDANREQARASSLASQERNREKCRARSRAWKEKNPDKIRAYIERNPDKERAKHRRYRETHPEKSLTACAMRRARIHKGKAIPFTAAQLRARLSMFAGCWMCGGPPEQIDHVIPLARGGPHILANLRPACGSCNRRKGAR